MCQVFYIGNIYIDSLNHFVRMVTSREATGSPAQIGIIIMFTVTSFEGTIAQVASASAAIKAAENYFQCQVSQRDRTLTTLRKRGHVIAYHCISDSFKVFIERTS